LGVVRREETFMKRLMTLMLGLSLVTTTVVVASTQDTTKKRKAKNKQRKTSQKGTTKQ